jgi:DNA-binding NarL/FixJ family response regulator
VKRGEHVGDQKIVRLLLVEDHASFRQALEAVIALEDDLELVGQSDRAKAAADLARRSEPDVAVVDLDLPGGSGVDAIRLIREASPTTTCMVLTALRDEVELGRAIEAGAAALVHKSVDIVVLLDAIRDVARGAVLLPPEATARFLSALSSSRADAWHAELLGNSLSPREREVLQLLADGQTNQVMAAELGISPETVQTHVRNLMGKLDVRTRLEAVTLALRLGLVEGPRRRLPGSG